MADAVVCTPSAPTIRISNIPIKISRDDLQKYLQELDSPLGTIAVNTAGDPYISLAPEVSAGGQLQRFQVATVTFSRLIHVPSPCGFRLGPSGAAFEVRVDTHFRGLTPLNNLDDAEIDIIAVTGLAGHAFGSWRSREGYGMWLRDFLPSDMQDDSYRARIFTYGYDTALVGSPSHAGIDHFSQQFIEAVKVARSECSSRPLILIGHSLGGLVIKDAIIQCFDSKDSTLDSVAGILFFSVPHKGLADASLVFMVQGQPNENLVRDLCGNTQFLRCLDRSFGYHMNLHGMGARIISFYETDETPTVKDMGDGKWGRSGPCVRMVTQESVIHAAGGGGAFPMDANHSSIVKFAHRSDQRYQLVRSKLLGIARIISISSPERKVPCEERLKICEWLYPSVVDKKHKEISGKRQENTGGWLLADVKFTSWRNGSGYRLLWGCGIPGAGKTFLSSLVIDVLDAHSRACSSTGLAYIYFDYMDQAQQMPIAVLRSLIKQLVARPRALTVPIPKPVRSLYDKNCAAGTTPEMKDLQDGLTASLALFKETFFVFDALDECREDLRKELLSLIHWIEESGARIFLTSRPYQDIAASLAPAAPNSQVERVELAAQEGDVMIYVEKTIQDHDDARNLIKDELRAAVVSRLVEACKGMFLLVRFYIEDLCEYPTTGTVRGALGRIGSEIGTESALHEAYGRVMDSIRSQHKSRSSLAFKALTWLLTANFTFTADELRMAVAMDYSSRQGNPNPFNEADMPNPFNEADMPAQSLILGVCRGLVMIDHNSHAIRFVHYSVHEYLEKTSALGDLAKRHLTVALGLLDYVWLSYIEPEPRRDCMPGGSKGLIHYARRNRHTHMQACHHIAPIETLLGFLRNTNLLRYLGGVELRMPSPPSRTARTRRVLLVQRPVVPGRSYHCAHAALLEATAWGSTMLVNRLVDDGADPYGAPGADTPLHVAACENLVDLVRFWLKKGVGVDAAGEGGGTPLSCAILRGSVGAAEVLLGIGAHVTTALQVRGWGDEEARDPIMLELLFNYGLSVERKLKVQTYLVQAIYRGDSAAVELLLRRGASIHSSDRIGCTPLHEAVVCNRIDIARLLLQHWYGGHEMEEEEEEEIVDRRGLLPQGAGGVGGNWRSQYRSSGHGTPVRGLVDARDCKGRTPLHLAAERMKPDMLQLLLSHGCDGTPSGHHVRAARVHEHAAAINARDKRGFTALSYATSWDKVHSAAMVPMLVDGGADLTVPPFNDGYFTWLHAAAAVGDVTLLKAALDAGVDPHARDGNTKSPLHHAAEGAAVEVVSLLMERGLTVKLRDKKDKTPLHYANGTATIAFLLERGASISSTDSSGNLPLHSRLYRVCDLDEDWDGQWDEKCGSKRLGEDLQLLINAGADVSARNGSDATPLHLAARIGCGNIVSLLLESGADIGALDVMRMSAMHHAATSPRDLGAISVLVAWGLRIDTRDKHQRAPLHHAVGEMTVVAHDENVDVLVRHLMQKGVSVDPRDSDGFTPLKYLVDKASGYRTLRAARTLAQAGADVNAVHEGGVSLLHVAAQKASNEMLALLLDAGANIHACDTNQRTPLHYALRAIKFVMVEEKIELLTNSGANVNARDIDGNTPLQSLLSNNWDSWAIKRVAKLLLSAGANVNTVNHKDKTSPLHVVARRGSKELLALILDASADIHARDRDQRTALHHAVLGNGDHEADSSLFPGFHFLCGWCGVAEMLISLGARVNTIDKDQNSPLHLAARIGCKALLATLLGAGANRNACNSVQEIPLDIAVNSGFSADVTGMLADRCSEHYPANQVNTGVSGAESVEMNDTACSNITADNPQGAEPGRKRRYSTAFPPQSNN